MIKLETFLFYVGISILLLCVLLTFIFFNPKQISEEENLVFMNSLTPKQIQLLVLNSIEEGDLILMKPKSFSDSYIYDQKIDKGFRIGEKDKNSHYDFTDEAIAESLGVFLNSKINDILAGGK